MTRSRRPTHPRRAPPAASLSQRYPRTGTCSLALALADDSPVNHPAAAQRLISADSEGNQDASPEEAPPDTPVT
eukprot:93422-Rhodomonas_salina.2